MAAVVALCAEKSLELNVMVFLFDYRAVDLKSNQINCLHLLICCVLFIIYTSNNGCAI